MDVKKKVIEFFRAKDKTLSQDEGDILKVEYMDARIIDSMGIVQMIVEFEKTFGIRFSAGNMQSGEFRTIGGLVSVIEQLLREKQNA